MFTQISPAIVFFILWIPVVTIARAALPLIDQVPRQQLSETAELVTQALERLGSPLSAADRARLKTAAQQSDNDAIETIQKVLDPYCLIGIYIDEEAWLRIQPSSNNPDDRRLVQYAWRTFLVKVHNEGTVTTPLEVTSPQALLPHEITGASPSSEPKDPDSWSRWIALRMVQDPPLDRLSGQLLDYMILQVYSRDAGIRAADLVFRLGGGQVRRGHYADTSLLFYIDSAVPEDQILQGKTKNGHYTVRIEPNPNPTPFHELFELEVAVFDATGQKLDNVEIDQLDAIMPAHQHGMKTQPEIIKHPDGTFRVRGMQFHMQGEEADGLWVIRVTVRGETIDAGEFDVQCCRQ